MPRARRAGGAEAGDADSADLDALRRKMQAAAARRRAALERDEDEDEDNDDDEKEENEDENDSDDDDDGDSESEDELVKMRRERRIAQAKLKASGADENGASSEDEGESSESEDELVKLRRAQKAEDGRRGVPAASSSDDDEEDEDDEDDDDDDDRDDADDMRAARALEEASSSSDSEDEEQQPRDKKDLDDEEEEEEEGNTGDAEQNLIHQLRETLREMPMQQLAKLKKEGLNGKPLHKALELPGPEYINAWLDGSLDLNAVAENAGAAATESKSPADATGKKRKRDAPIEVPATKQVSRFRTVVKAPKRERRDPRFMDTGNERDPRRAEKRYAFLSEARDQEIQDLQDALKKDRLLQRKGRNAKKRNRHRAMGEEERQAAMSKLTQLQQDRARHERESMRRDIKMDLKRKEREKVAAGKKAYFPKESELRKLELQKRYEVLQDKGKLDKFLEKRRKKLAAKDRKILPTARPPVGH